MHSNAQAQMTLRRASRPTAHAAVTTLAKRIIAADLEPLGLLVPAAAALDEFTQASLDVLAESERHVIALQEMTLAVNFGEPTEALPSRAALDAAIQRRTAATRAIGFMLDAAAAMPRD